MKAIVYERYGPPEVLHLAEVETPRPADSEILVEVYATTVSIGDVKMRKADPIAVRLFSGLLRPTRVPILGMELSGVVESAGKDVKGFAAGDRVFALTGFDFGAYAEYACLPQSGTAAKGGLVAGKPTNLSFEEAAAIPAGGITALVTLRKAEIQPGQDVLIYGASGAVGVAAVQLAKAYGARVTGVCSTSNLEMVKSLGAECVIDYTREDFIVGGERYDVIFDAADKLRAAQCRKRLKVDGIYLNVDKDSGDGKHITPDDLVTLKDLAEAGKLRPVIDRCYDMTEIAEAHRYVEEGHKRGNVVVKIKGDGD
jgi:NADPH:quinone reductase-like Zn-dependent oxidoreductase